MPTTKKNTALPTTKNARQSVTQPSAPKTSLKTAPKTAKSKVVPPETLQPSLFAPLAAKKAAPARKTTAKSAIAAPAPAKTAKKSAAKPSESLKIKGAVESAASVKATRKRVPADFALQYGENAERKPRKKVEEPAKRRPRRDAALRQKMRDVIEPGDELVARLRRAGMIAGSVPEDENKPARRAKVPARHAHSWEARCGKCGCKSTFLTPAGLCARCGAIMVREL